MHRLASLFVGACALAIGIVSAAQAAPITFTATGNANVSGFVTFDDSLFDGTTFQPVSNSTITALSLTVLGTVFDLSDVVVSGFTRFDSSGVVPRIVSGVGSLADNGAGTEILFSPDGWGGTVADGDATLGFDLPEPVFLAVRWVVSEVTDVPEPGTLALFGAGLAALGLMRRRRPAA